MDKLKFIGWTVFFMIVYYLFLTVIISIVTTFSSSAADEVNASPHASSYVLTVAALDYMPLALYFVPGVAAIVLIILKLKDKLPRVPRF